MAELVFRWKCGSPSYSWPLNNAGVGALIHLHSLKSIRNFSFPKTWTTNSLTRSIRGYHKQSVNTYFLYYMLYSTVSKLEKRCSFKMSQISKKFSDYIYWKIFAYTWTYAFQTSAVWESTVYVSKVQTMRSR